MIFKNKIVKAWKNIKELARKIAKTFAEFMENFTGWLLKAIKKVEEHLGLEVEGIKIFLEHVHDMFKEISKHYTVDERGQWHETTTTREISEDEVPKEILEKANNTKDDEITDEIQETLELAV